MYEIALSVSACLRAGTRVDVAWLVEAQSIPARAANEALAITPGGGRIGAVLGGAANDQLAEAARHLPAGRVVPLEISDFEAQLAGLPGGGQARCLVVPGSDLPPALWDRLHDRHPVCLVARTDGDAVAQVRLYDRDTIADAGEQAARLFARGASDTLIDGDMIITVLWPVPTLVIVGDGPITDALGANAALLGWRVRTVTAPGMVVGAMAGLAALDNVVVAAHDVELAGTALQAALAGRAGYLGALGSRRMQEARAAWLDRRGVTDLGRVHGPAGLDIGARTPAEIAVAILAEALAVQAGRR